MTDESTHIIDGVPRLDEVLVSGHQDLPTGGTRIALRCERSSSWLLGPSALWIA
jgi:hypothetical protein